MKGFSILALTALFACHVSCGKKEVQQNHSSRATAGQAAPEPQVDRDQSIDSPAIPLGFKIGIVGRQHVWTTVYPGKDGALWTEDDLREEGQMTVPTNVKTRLEIRSDDVIHALFIPRARVKKDAVPGRTNHFLMKRLESGEYDYFCTEYCGSGHSDMTGKLYVVSQEKYEAHLASLQGGSDR